MDKLGFLDALSGKGYKAEMLSGVPTVLGDMSEADNVKHLAESLGYNESFGIKKMEER